MESNLYVNKVSLTKEISNNNYLKGLSVVSNLEETDGIRFCKPVTFLVGENGVGKSTLIEAIAVIAWLTRIQSILLLQKGLWMLRKK